VEDLAEALVVGNGDYAHADKLANPVTDARRMREALEKLGVKNIYYESPNTAHEWQTWRRSLYQFAPLVFQD